MTIKIARFPWAAKPSRPEAVAPAAEPEPQGLAAFGSEEAAAPAENPAPRAVPASEPAGPQPRRASVASLKWVTIATGVAALVVASGWMNDRRAGAQTVLGKLTVQTTPTDLDVTIGGQRKGRTPLTLDLPAGSYSVQVGAGAVQRTLTTTVAAGASVVERLEIAVPAATGTLQVETDPPGLPVLVNGAARGKSPLTLANLEPGEYLIVTGTNLKTERRVTVRPSETVSAIIAAAEPAAPVTGTLSIASAFPLKVLENGRVIGTSDMERVVLGAGDHTLDLVNEELEFSLRRRVSVAAGKMARVSVDPPQGSLSINAQPWAEVWLDGRPLGQTPLGNVATPIGSHELVLRHPELGERRSTVTVGARVPARLGIDMRRK